MVVLIVLRRPSGSKETRSRRVQRSLNEMTRPGALLPGDPAEYIDEHVADAPPLFFGVFDPIEHREELVRRVDNHELHPHVLAGRTLDVLPLVFRRSPLSTKIHVSRSRSPGEPGQRQRKSRRHPTTRR